MNHTSAMMESSQDFSTQTTPIDFAQEDNGYAIAPTDVMLDMLDKILGAASSTTAANTTVRPGSLGTTNDTHYSEMNKNIFHGSNEILSLSTLKSLKNQLNSIMKSIQARSPELVVGTSQDPNPENYWLERLERTIGLLQAEIIKHESK